VLLNDILIYISFKIWLQTVELESNSQKIQVALVNCFLCLYAFIMVEVDTAVGLMDANLANALAKCLHSPLIGHALQFGLLFVQKTCIDIKACGKFI
jgi:hypothetical protein